MRFFDTYRRQSLQNQSFTFALIALSFNGFSTPFFLYSFSSLSRFLFQMPHYVLLVCSCMPLNQSNYMISSHIQHLFNFLRRQKIVQASQLQVSVIIACFFFKIDQKHVCIYESIEIKPDSIDCLFLEESNDALSRKRAQKLEFFEVFHKYTQIEAFSKFTVFIEGLSLFKCQLSVIIEYYHQFFDDLYAITIPFLNYIFLLLCFCCFFVIMKANLIEHFKNFFALLCLRVSRGRNLYLIFRIFSLFYLSFFSFRHEVFYSFEQLIKFREWQYSPIFSIDILINEIVLPKLIDVQIIYKFFIAFVRNVSTSKNVYNFRQFHAFGLIHFFQLLKIFFGLLFFHFIKLIMQYKPMKPDAEQNL